MLDPHINEEIRKSIILQASKLIGIPYKLGAKWEDFSKPPSFLDCSGLAESVFKLAGLKIPDGSQNQFNFTIALDKEKARPGDLAFFAEGKDITKIYHVGIVYSDDGMIEARAFDGRDWTGKVCIRERSKWESWHNFVGYRIHPKLL